MSELEKKGGEIRPEPEIPETITMYGPVEETPVESTPPPEEKRFIDKLPEMNPALRLTLRLGSTLLAIALIVGLLLAIVNGFTAQRIALENERAVAEGMAAVLPAADSFEPVDYSGDGVVTGISRGTAGGAPVGYAVTASPSGFGGPISLIVGVLTDGTVSGVAIVSLSETPGLGARAQEPAFLTQFVGKSGELAVTKTGEADKVNAISGATITSSAVTSGVNAALRAAAEVQHGN